LKKAMHGVFNNANRKERFSVDCIFTGLQAPKMAAHPCAERSLSKNCVFQQTASRRPAADVFQSRAPSWHNPPA
jgi:hypothetical protein